MTKILFLDCDGTIRQPKNGAKFISSPTDQQIIPGADVGINYHHQLGHIIIGITNQGGVEAGHKSLEDAIAEQRYTLELFPQIESIFFCPNYKGDIAWRVQKTGEKQYSNPFSPSYRKPEPGMVYLVVAEAIREHRMPITLSSCQMVGNSPEDEACAAAAGISFIPADMWVNCYRVLEKEYNETGDIA